MTTEYLKPIPTADTDSKPFWDGCKEHELRIPRCTDCGESFFPPQSVCPRCWTRDNVTFETAPGTGEIYTFSVVNQNKSRAWADDVPYAIGYVTLDGPGVQIFSNIVNVEDPFKLKIGQRVKVTFRDINDDVSIPLFEPA